MSSNVNECFPGDVAFVLVLVLGPGLGVWANADTAIAKDKVSIFRCIGDLRLSAQTLAEPPQAQTLSLLLLPILLLAIDLSIGLGSV
jgi:hypothetical protein